MRIAYATLLLTLGTAIASLSAQTATLSGIASVRDGTPLNGVRIRVRDANSNVVLAKAVTSSRGEYLSAVTHGSLVIECEASDRNSYATNPVTEHVMISQSSKSGKQDCFFDPVVTTDAYWKQVGVHLQVQAGNIADKQSFYTTQWDKIASSSLPPDSKAAAARQFKTMDWSAKISSGTFSDYKKVDGFVLNNALKGDSKALSDLPDSVGKQVLVYQSHSPDKVSNPNP